MDLSRVGWILILVYVLIGLAANFLIPLTFPKIPGDILIEKPGIRIYIPFVSPLIISIVLSYFLSSILR